MSIAARPPGLVSDTICLALWRMAGGKITKPVTCSMEELTALVRGIRGQVTDAEMRCSLERCLRGSWLERRGTRADNTSWGLTDLTRKHALTAAQALDTDLLPPATPQDRPLPAGPEEEAGRRESEAVNYTQVESYHRAAWMIDGLLDILSSAASDAQLRREVRELSLEKTDLIEQLAAANRELAAANRELTQRPAEADLLMRAERIVTALVSTAASPALEGRMLYQLFPVMGLDLAEINFVRTSLQPLVAAQEANNAAN